MINVILIDDEPSGIRSMELLVKKSAPMLKIVGATTDPVKGIDLINTKKPDVVFLDIHMPQLDGFQLLERLEYKAFHLIFTTAYSQHGLRALRNDAVDYLLKPVSSDDLAEAIERVQKKMTENQKAVELGIALQEILSSKKVRIQLPTRSTTELVSQSDIISIEASSNTCKVQLSSGQSIVVNRSLKEYDQQLCKSGMRFMRIHNSYIINLDYVVRFSKGEGGYVSLYGNKNVPVSRSKKEELLVWMSKFSGNHGPGTCR